MKRNTFFALAFAALAFAACNKDENGMSTLTLEGEPYTSDVKQAFNDGHLYFTAGDKALVNNNEVELTHVTRTSARIAVTGNQNGYQVNYPADGVYNENGLWKTEFLGEVELVSGNPNITTTMVVGSHQTWPMSGYVDSAHHKLKLLNNVAVLSPAIKYGVTWATAMWAEGGIDDQGWIPTNTALPEMYIDRVVISSSDMRLTGSATLKRVVGFGQQNYTPFVYDPAADGSGYRGPEYRMDGAPIATGDSVVCHVNPAFQAVATTSASTATMISVFGNLAVCPNHYEVQADQFAHLTVTYYFKAIVNQNVRYYKYTNTVNINGTLHFQRAMRTTFIANFYDMSNRAAFASRLVAKDTPFFN